MTTSSINHRPTSLVAVAVAATGLAGALLAVTLNGAHGFPGRDEPPAVVGRSQPTDGHYLERACFIKPLTWNEALEGSLPRCYTYVP